MNLQLIGLLLYVALQLVIGYVVSRRITSTADYLVAGRRLGYGLGIFTIFATWFGAETCMSSGGNVVREGLSLRSVEPFGYGFCLLFMGFIFAVPLWRRGILTLVDLFRRRYSRGVEHLAALLMAPPSILWAAAQIKAFAQVLTVTGEIQTALAIAVAAAIVIAYTALGGLLADAVTDLIQGIVLLVGLGVLAVMVIISLGGPGGAIDKLDASKISLLGTEAAGFWSLLESWTIPICGSVVAQELVARVIATRTPAIARRSALIAGVSYICVGLIPVSLALMSPALLPDLEAGNADQVVPQIARKFMGRALSILFAGALISAILSTVDSALLAAASVTSQNLLASFLPGLSDRRRLLSARACVIVFGATASLLALSYEGIGEIVEEASSFGTAGIFVILVFGLFTRFGGSRCAIGALLAGLLVYLASKHGWKFEHPYLLSLAAALGAYLAVGIAEKLPAALKAPGPSTASEPLEPIGEDRFGDEG